MARRHHPFLDAPPLRSPDAQAPASDLEGSGPMRCSECGLAVEGGPYHMACAQRRSERLRRDPERITSDELADRQVEREERRGQLERGRE